MFSKYRTTDGYNTTQKELQAIENSVSGHMLMEFGIQKQFLIEYALPFQSAVLKKNIPSLTSEQRSALFDKLHSAPYDSLLDNQREKYKFENLNKETLLLTIRSFDIGSNAEDVEHKRFVKQLDSIFLEIKNKNNVKNIIIDIRENGGGSDPNETILCTYFSKKPFRENVEAYTLTNEIPFPQYYNFNTTIDSLKKIKQKELEDELKMYFISPLLRIVNFKEDRVYRAFFQRNLKATVQGISLFGIVDMFVATGYQKPLNSYFFIHQYKQERKRDNDPLGQLVAEMLAAQEINNDSLPLYGCYVVGRQWYFVILQGTEYMESKPYDAGDKDEIQLIFKINSTI